MATKTTTKYIGTGFVITLIGLLLWFAGRPDILLEVGPDSFCDGTLEDPCYGYFNVTSLEKTIYFYNKDSNNDLLVEFDRPVRFAQLCINDKRCKRCGICPSGFRPLNLNESFYRDYKYVLKLYKGKKREFVVVGYKTNPSETVEWFINGIGPLWQGHSSPSNPGVDINNVDVSTHYLSWNDTAGLLNFSYSIFWPVLHNVTVFNDSSNNKSVQISSGGQTVVYVSIPKEGNVTAMNMTIHAYG